MPWRVCNILFSVQDWQLSMGNKWEKLPDQQKSQYLTQYRKALEEYKHDIQVWEEKMIRLGHIDVVRNEALIEPKEHSGRVVQRPRGSARGSKE
jgi:transcription factor A